MVLLTSKSVLTDEEIRILKAAAAGMTRAETADVWGMSYNHVVHKWIYIRRKLRAKTIAHAVVIAMREGYIR